MSFSEFLILLKHILKVEEQNKQIIGLLKGQGQINLYNYNKPVTEELPLKNLLDFHAFEERLSSWNSTDRNSFVCCQIIKYFLAVVCTYKKPFD